MNFSVIPYHVHLDWSRQETSQIFADSVGAAVFHKLSLLHVHNTGEEPRFKRKKMQEIDISHIPSSLIISFVCAMLNNGRYKQYKSFTIF